MTIWTSSAPTTPVARCHRRQRSATCCTWWRGMTMTSANRTPSTSSVGSARGLSLPTLRRNSLRNSSVLLPSLLERSSNRGRVIIISVSINKSACLSFIILFAVLNYAPLIWLSAAKPMHHHGQDCLRLKVDVVGHKGSGKTQLEKSKTENTGKRTDEGKGIFTASGGVHNPSNRLPAGEDSSILSNHSTPMPVTRSSGCVLSWRVVKFNADSPFPSSDDPAVMEPKVEMSIGSSGTQPVSFPLLFTTIPVLLALMLRWG